MTTQTTEVLINEIVAQAEKMRLESGYTFVSVYDVVEFERYTFTVNVTSFGGSIVAQFADSNGGFEATDDYNKVIQLYQRGVYCGAVS